MFAQDLNLYQSPTWQKVPKTSFTLQANALEFQYQLCQIFLKKTGQQLHQRQSEIMQDSNDLLKIISKRQHDKQKYTSTDSGTQSAPSSYREDDHSSPNTYAKRGEGGIWRKLDGRIGQWMTEIEEKCSALCLVNIKSIINDYRRLLQRWWELQARQGLIQRKNVHYERQQEENLILKEKLNSQNQKIDSLKSQIQCLKQKNESIMSYANERLQEMLGNQKIIEINGRVYRDVKNYLQEKEKNISKRILRVQLLQQQLLNKLGTYMPANSCENCCLMLRRLKQSLLKFKKYLENEGIELQNLFNKYKKTLFTQKNFTNKQV